MKYRMKVNSDIEPKAVAGTIVYDTWRPDYGLANDDSREYGRECISVTLREDGDYPLFTVPRANLEEIS